MKQLITLLFTVVFISITLAQATNDTTTKKHGIQKYQGLEGYKKKNYLAIDEIGGLFGLSGYAKNKYYFSYHTVNAYQFDPHAYAGLGAGFEIGGKNSVLISEPGGSNMAIMIPLFMEIRATLTSKKVAPFISQKGGYTFYLAGPTPSKKVIGGGMSQTQIGIKAFISKYATFNLSVGYRMQAFGVSAAYASQFEGILEPLPHQDVSDVSKSQRYWHFVSIHAGFTY